MRTLNEYFLRLGAIASAEDIGSNSDNDVVVPDGGWVRELIISISSTNTFATTQTIGIQTNAGASTPGDGSISPSLAKDVTSEFSVVPLTPVLVKTGDRIKAKITDTVTPTPSTGVTLNIVAVIRR